MKNKSKYRVWVVGEDMVTGEKFPRIMSRWVAKKDGILVVFENFVDCKSHCDKLNEMKNDSKSSDFKSLASG